MNYDTIKEEIKNIDITLPPPQEEPERQYYFIKKMQHWMEEKKAEKGRELTCCVNTFGWGNGAERKNRLSAAGYDYEEIQTIVNEICTPKKKNICEKIRSLFQKRR